MDGPNDNNQIIPYGLFRSHSPESISQHNTFPRRRVTFALDEPYGASWRGRSQSFASTTSGATEPPRVQYSSRSPQLSLNTSRLRLSGSKNPGVSSPTGAFLDDTIPEDENENSDVEYDSDISSDIFPQSDEEGDTNSSQPVANATQRIQVRKPNVLIHDVHKSQFESFGNEAGELRILLRTQNLQFPTVSPYCFRWTNCYEEKNMDFDAFTEIVLSESQLSINDKRDVKESLGHIRKQCEKPLYNQYDIHGRYMEPFVYQDLNLQDSPFRTNSSRKWTFLCFPFFSVDTFVKKIQVRSPSEHPPIMLVQSFARSSKPERELEQALCRYLATPVNQCFFVSQLWCLILDDGQIFTYSTLPEQRLHGDSISITKEPSRETQQLDQITVTDGGNCIWQLSLDKCQTWFDFGSHFMEISTTASEEARSFDEVFHVLLHGRIVKPEQWKSIFQKAEREKVQLVLLRRGRERAKKVENSNADNASFISDDQVFPWQMEEPPPAPHFVYTDKFSRENLPRDGHADSLNSSEKFSGSITRSISSQSSGDCAIESESSHESDRPRIDYQSFDTAELEPRDKFYALSSYAMSSWTEEGKKRNEEQKAEMYNTSLSTLLREIHQILSKAREPEKRAYQDVQTKTLPEVTKYLLVITLSGNGYKKRLSVFDLFFAAAVDIFELFLPLDNDSEIAKRYWGSVMFVLKSVITLPSKPPSFDAFKRVAYLARTIKHELSQPTGPDLTAIKIPVEFIKAWRHCILYLVLFRFRNRYSHERERHLEKCELLLRFARKELWRNTADEPLIRKEVAPPLAMLSLVIGNLVKDVNKRDMPIDIFQVYLDRMKTIEMDVKLGRVKNTRPEIGYLQQEIKAIFQVLESQKETLLQLLRVVFEQCNGWTKLSSPQYGHAARHEIPLIAKYIAQINNRIYAFEDIEIESIKLQKWVNEQAISTKHRQEKAIYAFTIVTVVFLPLSFVTSFLGMNTADIRDMEAKQWIFWASALPLTLVVVVSALLWTDELSYAWATLHKRIAHHRIQNHGFSPYHGLVKIFSGKGNRNPTVQAPPSTNAQIEPMIESPRNDAWAKPYRRSSTFRSMM